MREDGLIKLGWANVREKKAEWWDKCICTGTRLASRVKRRALYSTEKMILKVILKGATIFVMELELLMRERFQRGVSPFWSTRRPTFYISEDKCFNS